MNAVEIEEAITTLAEQPFDSTEFPFAFLEAFGNKVTTLKRLRKGESNKSDLGGVLQTNNIHIAVAAPGEVTKMLAALKASPATVRARAKFILATDGETFEAEDLASGETVACGYREFPDHFGFFLPLAGITTVQQVRESSFDIRATSRLNRLYVELLKDNPEWGTEERRPDMNHFMARLIFCFFAEDTEIFQRAGSGKPLFTLTVETMSARDSSNTHEVIGKIFLALNLKSGDREVAGVPRWAGIFPYVNGGLFSGSLDVPRFSKIARSYLLHIGGLDWTRINPDIFGSMIQAVAEDEERGALGMHYTSVPNILKVLNPLFLADLRAKLEEAGDNARKLLNLRNRIAKIRVFDPACGSGNFLVIAYKEMRAIEAEVNSRRGEGNRRSDIPLTNFRGIELRDFPAEVARLALIIAEYQCDVLHRGQKLALAEFLPLEKENWITCGNALRLDWLNICPPTGTGVKLLSNDLFETPLNQAEIDFENEGGETYICGNPPYYGSRKQTDEQKSDLAQLAAKRIPKWKSLDYVAGWFLKGKEYIERQPATFAFVCTSSTCEGLQVPVLWRYLLSGDAQITFAYRPFKWANLAANNAGVTVNIVGVSNVTSRVEKKLFEADQVRSVSNISPYLLATQNIFVDTAPKPPSQLSPMITGSMPRDGGHLILSFNEADALVRAHLEAADLLRPYVGTDELVKGNQRRCLWIEDDKLPIAEAIPAIADRLRGVRAMRAESPLVSTQEFADRPHRFVYLAGQSKSHTKENKLGRHLGQIIARGKAHILAMTGSYFRGDAEAVLSPLDEAKFDTVTYTYYEQLNGYEYLKTLDIGYFFYSGSYTDDILKVLDPAEKTIIHIPSVTSRESTKDKIKEVEHIIEELGEWQGTDPATGFQLVKTASGKDLKIADLVDDDSAKRDRVSAALKDPEQKNNRDHVDIIIALGMAKEGFDWIWCEHALTIGYRASLTEIVQIIGRATRDAPGKTRARFTNLIAEPDAAAEAVTEAVNDTLKAIAASLLMEQVLAPRFEFRPKNPSGTPTAGFDYGPAGYDPSKCNIGLNEQTGHYQIEINGLSEPKSPEAQRICREDLNEVIAAFVQDKTSIERGLFDQELVPEELTQVRMGKIIKDKYPELSEQDQESVRQHAVAALNLTQQAKQIVLGGTEGDEQATPNTALIDGIRKFAMDVRELDIDLIDRINPFGEAYAILAKTMSEESLKQVQAAISARRVNLTPEEARELAKRALRFKQERGRLPSITSADAWEKRMAEGVAYLARMKAEAERG